MDVNRMSIIALATAIILIGLALLGHICLPGIH